jgi:hypothetical protein
MPQAPTVVAPDYQFRRTPAGTLVVNEQFRGSGLVAINRALELISARIMSTTLNLPSGVQTQLELVLDLLCRLLQHWREGAGGHSSVD